MPKQKKIGFVDDDASINASAEVDSLWSIANTLWGTYSPDKNRRSGDFLPCKLPKRLVYGRFFAASSAKNPQVQ
jgi:hypothetical protein